MNNRSILIAMLLIMLSILPSPILASRVLAQSGTIDITIAYTHDIHSHLYSEWTGTNCEGGMTLLSTKVQELRALRPVLLLDCGDTMTGAPVNDFNNGIPMIEVMNAIGYDAMTMDNHEFDPGIPALKAMIDTADFEMLSANVEWPGTPKPLPYSIETVAGYNIGIVGLTPPFWYSPIEATFNDMVASANAAVSDLENLGIGFIILLGALPSSLASSISDLDLIIKGSRLETIGNTLVLPSVGTDASRLGVLDVTIDTTDGTIVSYNFSSQSLDSSLEPDENIVAIIDSWNTPLATALDTPVGYFQNQHNIDTLGLMLSESILRHTGADVGTYNIGGVRSVIDKGFITYRDLYKMEPFFNYVATLDLKGADIQQVIGSNYAATSIGAFNPSSWYKVASSNFSITYFELVYSPNTTNRHDYSSETIVDLFAEYLMDEFPVSKPALLEVIDGCRSSIVGFPDSYLEGGTPSTLKTQINNELFNARNALVADDAADALDHLLTANEMLEAHVVVSCPLRWFAMNINNVIYYLSIITSTSITTSTTVTTNTTSTFTNTTSSTSLETPGILESPWISVIIVELVVLVVAVSYYFGLFQKIKRG